MSDWAGYVPPMTRPETPGAAAFAQLIVEARNAKGWTQERLMAEADLSKSTLNRWENGRTADPELAVVRRACLALGIDPIEAAIALGIVTRAEVGRGERPSPIDPGLIDAARLLADPKIPDVKKAQLRRALEVTVNFWYEQLGVIRRPQRAPRTPKR